MALRVAIIGCGYIAGFADDTGKRPQIFTHAKALSLSKKCKLVACCDNDTRQLKKFSKRWDIKKIYTDIDEMLSNNKIDIVTVASPSNKHFEHIHKSTKYNIKAIFCEKPLTHEIKTSKEIIKICKEKNIKLAVNFMRRWDQFFGEVKQVIQSEKLGKIDTTVAYVDTALYTNSIHMIDLICYLIGNVKNVIGKLDKKNKIRVVNKKKDPGAILLLEHQNDSFTFIKATGESMKNHFFEIDINFSGGRIRILDDGSKYEIYKFKPIKEKKWLSKLYLSKIKENKYHRERLVDAYTNISQSIINNEKINSSGESSLQSLKIIDEVHRNKKI